LSNRHVELAMNDDLDAARRVGKDSEGSCSSRLADYLTTARAAVPGVHGSRPSQGRRVSFQEGPPEQQSVDSGSDSRGEQSYQLGGSFLPTPSESRRNSCEDQEVASSVVINIATVVDPMATLKSHSASMRGVTTNWWHSDDPAAGGEVDHAEDGSMDHFLAAHDLSAYAPALRGRSLQDVRQMEQEDFIDLCIDLEMRKEDRGHFVEALQHSCGRSDRDELVGRAGIIQKAELLDPRPPLGELPPPPQAGDDRSNPTSWLYNQFEYVGSVIACCQRGRMA